MKNKTILLVLLFLTIVITGCTTKQQTPIDNDSTQLHDINATLAEIEDALINIETEGDSLVSYFQNYLELDNESKLKVVQSAETSNEKLRCEYDRILALTNDVEPLQNISYQIRLLRNLIPQPVTNDLKSLNNAVVLYQLYFQQLSSSFSIIASNIDDIGKEQNISYSVGYYYELKNMPMPDTMIMGIEFSSKVKENGIIKYTYISDKDNTNAQLNYNLYLVAVGMDTGLSLKFDGAAAYVYKENTMVSAIMAGNDAKLGNFFMVSFPE